MLRFKGFYSLLIGFCMVILWCMLLVSGQVSELVTEPYRIMAHLFSEFLTAAFLIGGGISVLKSKRNTTLLNIGLGALLYSVLTAGGYYLQRGDMAMTVMFGVFLILTSICILDSMNASGDIKLRVNEAETL